MNHSKTVVSRLTLPGLKTGMALGAVLLLHACAANQTVEVAKSTGAVVESGVSQTAGGVSSAVTQTANGVGGAVTAPLHDFNLVKEAIPDVLLKARDDPYALAGLDNCPALLSNIADLDLALGPDIDTPRDLGRKTAYTTSASTAAEMALDAVKDTAEGVIPMKSWVRKLSGAEKNDKRIRQAIDAGHIRRAFLKGLGVMYNCTWPAAPLNFEPRKTPKP